MRGDAVTVAAPLWHRHPGDVTASLDKDMARPSTASQLPSTRRLQWTSAPEVIYASGVPLGQSDVRPGLSRSGKEMRTFNPFDQTMLGEPTLSGAAPLLPARRSSHGA